MCDDFVTRRNKVTSNTAPRQTTTVNDCALEAARCTFSIWSSVPHFHVATNIEAFDNIDGGENESLAAPDVDAVIQSTDTSCPSGNQVVHASASFCFHLHCSSKNSLNGLTHGDTMLLVAITASFPCTADQPLFNESVE